MPISLLEQAKSGDATAIAMLMNQALEPKGVSVSCDRLGNCLQLRLIGDSLPPQGPTVAYVQRGLERLQVASIAALQIYAGQASQPEPAWGVEVALDTVPPEVRPLPLDRPTPPPELSVVPTPEPGADDAVLAPEPDAQPDPGSIAAAYALLGLEPGDSLEKVEGTYFKVKALALREGDRARVEQLKQTFRQLKDYIENPPPQAEAPSPTVTAVAPATDPSRAPEEQVERLLRQRRVAAQVKVQGDQLLISWLAVRVTNSEDAATQVHALLTQQDMASMGLQGVKTLVISALNREHGVVWQHTYPLGRP